MKSLSVENKVLIKDINLKLTNSFIIGENGSGKTTLMKSIYKEYTLNNSYIYYLSPETENMRVFKDYYPLSIIKKTIEANRNISENCQEIMTIIEKHFGNDLNKRIGKLSGGQKQLSNVLIMIFGDFDLVLIDELEKSLSKDKILILMDMISKYKKNSIKIFVTHDQDLLNKYQGYQKIVIKDKKIAKLTGNVLIEGVI